MSSTKQNVVAVLNITGFSIKEYLVLKRLETWSKKGYNVILVIDDVLTDGTVIEITKSHPVLAYVNKLLSKYTMHLLSEVLQDINSITKLLQLIKLVDILHDEFEYISEQINSIIVAYSVTYFDAAVFINTMSVSEIFVLNLNSNIDTLKIDRLEDVINSMDLYVNKLRNICLFSTDANSIYEIIRAVPLKVISEWNDYLNIFNVADKKQVFAFNLIKDIYGEQMAASIVWSASSTTATTSPIPTYVIPEESTTVWNTLINAGVIEKESQEYNEPIFLNGERVDINTKINLMNRDNVLRYKDNIRVLI